MKRIILPNNSLLNKIDKALLQEKRWVYFLFAVAFLLKLVFILQSRDSIQITVPILDAKYYDDLAQDIARGHVIRKEAFFMGPLYPYIMALVYSVFGRNIMLMRLVQISGGALSVVLTYLIGLKVFRPSTAMLGALMLALYGAITFYEGQILMMWLGTLLNLLLLYVLLYNPRKTGIFSFLGNHFAYRYILAGALLGLSALARASILIMLPGILIWLILIEKGERRFIHAAVFIISVVIAIVPVTIHNYVASKDLVPITSNFGLNIYIGNSEEAAGVYFPPKGPNLNSDGTTERFLERKLGRDLKPSDISRHWSHQAMAFVKEHPRQELSLLFRKFMLFINGYEWPQIENYALSKAKYGIFQVLFINFWTLSALGIIGIIYSLRRWRQTFLLHWFIISYSASIILFFVTGRYRIQIVPILCLFAAYAVIDISTRIINHRSRGLFALLLLAGVFMVTRPGLYAIDEQHLVAGDHIQQAWRYDVIGETDRALEEMNAAVRLRPNDSEPYLQRAAINKKSGRFQEAIRDYTSALEINPVMPVVHYNLAQVLEEEQMYVHAIQEYSKAIDQDSLMLEAYNNLGIIYQRMNEHETAIRYFRKIIKMNPDYIKAYNNMGALYAERGDKDAAIASFEEAIRRAPDYPYSYKNCAMAYIETNRLHKAAEYLEKYLELSPDDIHAAKLLRDVNDVLEADIRR